MTNSVYNIIYSFIAGSTIADMEDYEFTFEGRYYKLYLNSDLDIAIDEYLSPQEQVSDSYTDGLILETTELYMSKDTDSYIDNLRQATNFIYSFVTHDK